MKQLSLFDTGLTYCAKRMIVYVRIHNAMKTEQAIAWLDKNMPGNWRKQR